MNIIQYKTIATPKLTKFPEMNITVPDNISFKNPDIIYDFMTKTKEIQIDKNIVECLYMLCLDKKYHILGIYVLSKGTTDTHIVSPRDVIINAALAGSVNVVLVHNHPSGDPTPSEADKKLTRGIAEALDICGMLLIDHIVIGNNQYKSICH